MGNKYEQALDQWMGGFSDVNAAFSKASAKAARAPEGPKSDVGTEYKKFAELDLSNMGW